MRELKIRLHEIAVDGLPDPKKTILRKGFIFDGCIVSGWPLMPEEFQDLYEQLGVDPANCILWEADSDVGHTRPFIGVTHWVEFSLPINIMEREDFKDASGQVYGETFDGEPVQSP